MRRERARLARWGALAALIGAGLWPFQVRSEVATGMRDGRQDASVALSQVTPSPTPLPGATPVPSPAAGSPAVPAPPAGMAQAPPEQASLVERALLTPADLPPDWRVSDTFGLPGPSSSSGGRVDLLCGLFDAVGPPAALALDSSGVVLEAGNLGPWVMHEVAVFRERAAAEAIMAQVRGAMRPCEVSADTPNGIETYRQTLVTLEGLGEEAAGLKGEYKVGSVTLSIQMTFFRREDAISAVAYMGLGIGRPQFDAVLAETILRTADRRLVDALASRPAAVTPPAPTLVAPAMTAPSAGPGTVLATDNFDDPLRGHVATLVDDSQATAQYAGGEYAIQRTEFNSSTVTGIIRGSYSDAALAIDVRLIDGQGSGQAVGLYCRARDLIPLSRTKSLPLESGYRFLVATSGLYELHSVAGGRLSKQLARGPAPSPPCRTCHEPVGAQLRRQQHRGVDQRR
ncbi:MAG: hypothetical protein U0531_07775 [Dehalococcoidia bacterium]